MRYRMSGTKEQELVIRKLIKSRFLFFNSLVIWLGAVLIHLENILLAATDDRWIKCPSLSVRYLLSSLLLSNLILCQAALASGQLATQTKWHQHNLSHRENIHFHLSHLRSLIGRDRSRDLNTGL